MRYGLLWQRPDVTYPEIFIELRMRRTEDKDDNIEWFSRDNDLLPADVQKTLSAAYRSNNKEQYHHFLEDFSSVIDATDHGEIESGPHRFRLLEFYTVEGGKASEIAEALYQKSLKELDRHKTGALIQFMRERK